MQVKSECQSKLRKDHITYTESIFNAEGRNCGPKFWAYIKHKWKDSCRVAPLRQNGVLISDAVGKANILNEQYCSVFNKNNRGSVPSKDQSPTPNI